MMSCEVSPMSDALYALAAHALGDYPLQTDHMAENKIDDGETRAKHVAVYTLSFLPVALASDWSHKQAAVYLGGIASTHYVIDSRRWNDAVPIWYDQALHVIALAVVTAVVRALGGETNER